MTVKKGSLLDRLNWAEGRADSPSGQLVLNYLVKCDGPAIEALYPGQGTIAKACSLSTRSVQRALGDLECLGLISSEARYYKNHRATNVYTIHYGADGRQIDAYEGRQIDAQGEAHGRHVDAAMGDGMTPPRATDWRSDNKEVNREEKQGSPLPSAQEEVLIDRKRAREPAPSGRSAPSRCGDPEKEVAAPLPMCGDSNEPRAGWRVEAGFVQLEPGYDTGDDQDRLQRYFEAVREDSDFGSATRALEELIARHPQDPKAALRELTLSAQVVEPRVLPRTREGSA